MIATISNRHDLGIRIFCMIFKSIMRNDKRVVGSRKRYADFTKQSLINAIKAVELVWEFVASNLFGIPKLILVDMVAKPASHLGINCNCESFK